MPIQTMARGRRKTRRAGEALSRVAAALGGFADRRLSQKQRQQERADQLREREEEKAQAGKEAQIAREREERRRFESDRTYGLNKAKLPRASDDARDTRHEQAIKAKDAESRRITAEAARTRANKPAGSAAGAKQPASVVEMNEFLARLNPDATELKDVDLRFSMYAIAGTEAIAGTVFRTPADYGKLVNAITSEMPDISTIEANAIADRMLDFAEELELQIGSEEDLSALKEEAANQGGWGWRWPWQPRIGPPAVNAGGGQNRSPEDAVNALRNTPQR